MNIRQTVITLSILAILGSAPLQAGGRGAQNLQSSNTSELSTAETKALLFMREEEKLARDVYRNAYDTWEQPIFLNIASAEQRHMDAIAGRIAAYGLEDQDPVTDNTVGVFVDEELDELFKSLDTDASLSLMDALKTGAFIEEVDIDDLEQAIRNSDHPDVTRVYENLLKGSRNHLRAFVRQIESLGGDAYESQFMEQDDVDMIVDQPMERRAGRRGR